MRYCGHSQGATNSPKQVLRMNAGGPEVAILCRFSALFIYSKSRFGFHYEDFWGPKADGALGFLCLPEVNLVDGGVIPPLVRQLKARAC